MGAVSFDTLAFARALRDEAKFTPEQAEGTAKALAGALMSDLATKSDLKDLDARFDTRLKEFELRVDSRFKEFELRVDNRFKEFELRVDNRFKEFEARLDQKLAETRAEILKWMFGAVVAQTALIVALIKLIP